MNGVRGAVLAFVLGVTVACRVGDPARGSDEAARVVPPAYAAPVEGAAPVQIDRYWELLGSEDLNALVQSALAHNHSLRAALEAVQAAGWGARVAWSDRFPSVDGQIGLGFAERVAGSAASAPSGALGWSSELGVAARYEIDLWGRAGAEHSRAKAELAASAWDHRAARMSLVAEVALRWIDVRVASALLTLLQAQSEAMARSAQLVELRYKQGDAAWTDVLGLRSAVCELAERRALVRQRQEAATAELRLLTGRRMESGPRTAALPDVPPLPDPGLPADLVLRRPDVQAAWYRLRAAAWTAASRDAARLPTLRLGGRFATVAATPAGLFESWIGSLVGDLTGPLFDFFGRKAAAEQAQALARGRLEDLSQALLAACRDVEVALSAHRALAARYEAVRERVAISQSRAQQLENRYRNGAADYLDLYFAELGRMEAERTELSARADLLTQRVQLARALGGGWQKADSDAAVEDLFE